MHEWMREGCMAMVRQSQRERHRDTLRRRWWWLTFRYGSLLLVPLIFWSLCHCDPGNEWEKNIIHHRERERKKKNCIAPTQTSVAALSLTKRLSLPLHFFTLSFLSILCLFVIYRYEMLFGGKKYSTKLCHTGCRTLICSML